MRPVANQVQALPSEPLCATCGHAAEEHDCIGETSDCLNTRCNCRQYRPQAPAPAPIAASDASYTSEPIPGRESVFYAGDRYYANSEDARRARLELARSLRIIR